tara:strand:- start:57 stop:296 length:240 start_codon:yes stop_codon:yes gene_type:complete
MAFKGTAGKSSSGASMSKYDVEVEARLQKLEAAVAALQNHSHGSSGGGGSVAAGAAAIAAEDVTPEEKVDHLINLLASS